MYKIRGSGAKEVCQESLSITEATLYKTGLTMKDCGMYMRLKGINNKGLGTTQCTLLINCGHSKQEAEPTN
eukprot:1097084-Pleurochrysis_carterae.AAC.1